MSFCVDAAAALFVRKRPWGDTFCRSFRVEAEENAFPGDLPPHHFPSWPKSNYTLCLWQFLHNRTSS
jgi:hypothetical protein